MLFNMYLKKSIDLLWNYYGIIKSPVIQSHSLTIMTMIYETSCGMANCQVQWGISNVDKWCRRYSWGSTLPCLLPGWQCCHNASVYVTEQCATDHPISQVEGLFLWRQSFSMCILKLLKLLFLHKDWCDIFNSALWNKLKLILSFNYFPATPLGVIREIDGFAMHIQVTREMRAVSHGTYLRHLAKMS